MKNPSSPDTFPSNLHALRIAVQTALVALSAFPSFAGTVNNHQPTFVERQSNSLEGSADPGDSLMGKTAPNIVGRSYDGKRINLRNFRGKYVLLEFWEAGCEACPIHFPETEGLLEDYGSKGLSVLGLTTSSKAAVGEILSQYHLPYPTLLVDNSVIRAYQVWGRPTFVLINPKGRIVQYSVGSLADIASFLESRL